MTSIIFRHFRHLRTTRLLNTDTTRRTFGESNSLQSHTWKNPSYLQPPSALVCPISQSLLQEPVILNGDRRFVFSKCELLRYYDEARNKDNTYVHPYTGVIEKQFKITKDWQTEKQLKNWINNTMSKLKTDYPDLNKKLKTIDTDIKDICETLLTVKNDEFSPVLQEFAEKLLDLPDDFVCRAIDPKVQSPSINLKTKSINNSQHTVNLIEKSIDYVCDSGQNAIESLRNHSKTRIRSNRHSYHSNMKILSIVSEINSIGRMMTNIISRIIDLIPKWFQSLSETISDIIYGSVFFGGLYFLGVNQYMVGLISRLGITATFSSVFGISNSIMSNILVGCVYITIYY